MQGAYGLVCSGTNTDTGKKVAIKKIPKAFEDTIDCKRLLREIKILRHFKHDNVLGLLDILPPTGSVKEWKDVYIVSELMDTDLHYIIHSKQPLTDEHFKYFLYQILRGVHAIHSAHVPTGGGKRHAPAAATARLAAPGGLPKAHNAPCAHRRSAAVAWAPGAAA